MYGCMLLAVLFWCVTWTRRHGEKCTGRQHTMKRNSSSPNREYLVLFQRLRP